MDREDQKTREERVEKLWHTLDTRKEGQLNLQGLQKGLGIMDHRKCWPATLESLLIVR